MDKNKSLIPLKTNQAIELFKIDREYRIDSRILADGMGLQHESFIKLLRKYQNLLEKLGLFRFEIGKIDGRGRPENYVMLNRSQAGFALTLSRPTEQTVNFRFDLIVAFELATNPKLLQPNSSRFQLTGEEEQKLILQYVERLQHPTARDLGRYFKRYPIAYLREMLAAYAEQGLLIEWRTAHAQKYAIKPQQKLIEAAASQ